MSKPQEFLKWYNVYEYPLIYGFAVDDEGFVLKAAFNISWMLGEQLQDVKYYFIQNKCKVVLIGEAVKVM